MCVVVVLRYLLVVFLGVESSVEPCGSLELRDENCFCVFVSHKSGQLIFDQYFVVLSFAPPFHIPGWGRLVIKHASGLFWRSGIALCYF